MSLDHTQLDLNVEANRLLTFANWTNPNVTPQSLAKAGFFYAGIRDQVSCFHCHVEVGSWEKEEDPLCEHAKWSPNCPFVRSVNGHINDDIQRPETLGRCISAGHVVHRPALGSWMKRFEDISLDFSKKEDNFWLMFSSIESSLRTFMNVTKTANTMNSRCSTVDASAAPSTNLGIQQITTAECSKFSSLDARLRTYTNWPISDIQRPESLAQAGLYYDGIKDQVSCFHCHVRLCSWEKDDDPWFEHAKWSTDCTFVRSVKGPNYVQKLMQQSASRKHVAMSFEDDMFKKPVLQESGKDVEDAVLTDKPLSYDAVENLLNQQVTDFAIGQLDAAGTAQLGQAAVVTINSNSTTTEDSSQVVATQPHIISPINIANATSSQGIDVPPTSLKLNTTAKTTVSSSSTADAAVYTPNAGTAESTTTPCCTLENRHICKVCLDVEVGVLFLPCCHLITCVQCASAVSLCPICHTAIQSCVRTYLC